MSGLRYLTVGVTLFALKFAIDHTVAAAFGRAWSFYNYLFPVNVTALQLLGTPGSAEAWFFLTLLAVAVPFVAVGTWATYRRLIDAGAPRAWVLLFFVPVLNLILFAVLTVLPRKTPKESPPAEPILPAGPPPAASPDRPALVLDMRPAEGPPDVPWLPKGGETSPLVAALLAAPVIPVFSLFAVFVLRDYGWGLFVGMPFVAGFLAAVLNGLRRPRSLGSSLSAAMLATVIGMVMTFLFAIEGLICLVFLVPLATPIALVGGLIGHGVQARLIGRPRTWAAVLLMLPAVMGAEAALRDRPAVFEVVTAVEVDAPPEAVWPHVVSFSDIARPDDWFFRFGAAYPIRARIDGRGVGAVRYCEFSTGPFVEPITVWDEPRRLAFAVTHNPPPLREWSPFDIHPPHLESFLRSHRGQFELIPLPGGRTRLVGTTWYEHGMWPEAYWRLWTDWVIHKIHRRVLEHVRDEVTARPTAVAQSTVTP